MEPSRDRHPLASSVAPSIFYKTNRICQFPRSETQLRATIRTFNGETAVVRLEGSVTGAQSDPLCRTVQMLLDNDYVAVIIDATSVTVGDGGVAALLKAREHGASLMVLGE